MGVKILLLASPEIMNVVCVNGYSYISCYNQFFIFKFLAFGCFLFLSLRGFPRRITLIFGIASMNPIDGLSENYLVAIVSSTTAMVVIACYILFDRRDETIPRERL